MASDYNGLKVTLLFPLFDNEGAPFVDDVWNWWRGEMTILLAAFTDLGVVTGWWQEHSDENRWIVAVVKSPEQVKAVRVFLRKARRKFRQRAMYLEYHAVHFEEVR